jgi:carbon-monoxide dehydrogenase large subunit
MPINTGSETAKITIDSTGAVTAAFGIASHGQGLETTLAQIIADDLGASFADIRIIQGDSDAVPMSTGTYASRSAVLGGGAAKHAALILRDKVRRVASRLLEASQDDIEVYGGKAFVCGTDRAVTFRQIAKAVYSDMKTLPVEAREELAASHTYDPVVGTTAAATHIAAVEIDPATCSVRIHKYVVAEDCGRIINPMIVDGQVHGGVAQGIGAALYEELVYDDAGQSLTGSLVDYVIPAAPDVPVIDVVHVETESAVAGGFRGMGEGGAIGAPAAIANAIADALSPLDAGVNILPMTPARIFKLIEKARLKAQGSTE